jgi:hypothetical protein
VRVGEHGRVHAAVTTSRGCFAVGLLPGKVVCCTAETSNPTTAATRRTGRLEIADAGVVADRTHVQPTSRRRRHPEAG